MNSLRTRFIGWIEERVIHKCIYWFSSVQSFIVSDSATPRTVARQASLSITNSLRLPKFMSTESVMPSNHLILCHSLLLLLSIFPRIRIFSNESALWSGGQSIGVSASTSVLPMNIQYICPLGWTGWISLHSKELSIVFPNTTAQKHKSYLEPVCCSMSSSNCCFLTCIQIKSNFCSNICVSFTNL